MAQKLEDVRQRGKAVARIAPYLSEQLRLHTLSEKSCLTK
jgi:hypothetical protein